MTVALEDYYLYIAVLELDMQSVNGSDNGDQDQLQPENTNSTKISKKYRKWSIKRRGAYFIFPVTGAALISTKV